MRRRLAAGLAPPILGAMFSTCGCAPAPPSSPAASADPADAPAGRPHVVLLAADDLGPYLGAAGEVRIRTPHLDALAASSLHLPNTWVSQASCSSSRSTLVTGLFPHTNGQLGLVQAGYEVHREHLELALPGILSRAGYRTGLIGKFHVAPDSAFAFDFSEPDVRAARSGEWIANRLGEFLSADDGRPIFLLVSYSDPHALRNLETREFEYPAQIDGLPARPVAPSEETLFEFQGFDWPAGRVRCANYLNAVARLDDAVGRTLRALEENGVLENALVVFYGDHGPPFVRAKMTCYDAGLRIPFLVRFPDGGGRGPHEALASSADVYPTILEACGQPVPAGRHGVALQRLIDGRAPWREFLFSEYHAHGPVTFYPRRTIRDARYQLIENLLAGESRPVDRVGGDDLGPVAANADPATSPGLRAFETFRDPPRFELYDLETDPAELTNRSEDPALRNVREELARRLTQWRVETGDPFLDAKTLREHRPPKPPSAHGDSQDDHDH